METDPRCEEVQPGVLVTEGEAAEMTAPARRVQLARVLVKTTRPNQMELARKYGVSEATIRADLKKIRRAWRDEMVKSTDQIIAQDLAELSMVKQEAWFVYERSITCGDVVTTETDSDKGGNSVTVTTSDPKPNLRALDMVVDCIKMKRRILGIEKAGEKKAPRAFAFTVKIGEKVILAESSTAEPSDVLEADFVEVDSSGRQLPSGSESGSMDSMKESGGA